MAGRDGRRTLDPLTLFITLGVAMLAGQTINRITLFALILSLGLLVDDAIVVIENVHRQMRMGTGDRRDVVAERRRAGREPDDPRDATVILAFLPMAFVTGLMGPYMRPIPLDVPVAMIASLVRRDRRRTLGGAALLKAREAESHANPGRWQTFYRRALGALLEGGSARRAFLGLVAGAVALAMLLPLVQAVKFRMLPSQNENTFSVAIDEPIGTDLERTRLAAIAVEKQLLADRNVRDIETFVGTNAVPDFNGVLRGSFFRQGAWFAELRVNLLDKGERRESSEEIVRRLRPSLQSAGALYAANVRLVEEPPWAASSRDRSRHRLRLAGRGTRYDRAFGLRADRR